MFRRFGRPGLLGLAAGTAVVAGTATAVSGGIRRHQYAQAEQSADAAAYQAQQQQEAMNQAAAAAVAAQQPPAAAAPAATPAGDDLYAKLNQLASLHSQGVLTDEEFAAAKSGILGL